MKKTINKLLSNKNLINLYDEHNHDSIYITPKEEVERSYKLDLENLKKDLSKKKNRHMLHMGLINDAYPTIEEKLNVTKEVLDIVYDYAYGISIYTKSNLILRDIDILSKINEQKKVVVMIPITTYSDQTSKLIEPNSATTKERYNILSECNKRGIETVVWINPILPYINDSVESIKSILQNCKKYGVKAIITLGLGLNINDDDREYFFKNIYNNFPSVRDRYVEQFSEDNNISTPKNITLENIIFKYCLDNNMMYGIEKIFEYLNEFPERESLFDFI